MNWIFGFLLLSMFTANAVAQDSDTIAIENVNVIPMTSETVLHNRTVLIASGKIVKIEDAQRADLRHVRVRISGKGKYLIPGLSEMHYHFRSNDIASDIKLFVANGITTVRSMSASPNQNQPSIRERIRSGELPGINYYTTGIYLTSRDLGSSDKVVEIVRQHKDAGFDFLKIADNLQPDIYLELLEECEKNGLPVIGHSQRDKPLEYSLRMKSIEHLEEFVYLSDSAQQPSFFKQGERGITRLAEQVKASGISIGTTLSVMQFINNCMTDERFRRLQSDPLAKYLAKNERDAFLSEKNDYRKLRKMEFDGVPAPKLFSNYFQWMKRCARVLDSLGVPLLSGSDTYGMVIVGFSLHDEFRLMQESGIKPYHILLASTVNPARFLNTSASSGTVAIGKNADLVLLNKNPLEDINNTTSIAGVFLKGRWFDRETLDTMLRDVERAFK